MDSVSLARHPDSAGDTVSAVRARIARTREDLKLSYVLEGNLARIRVPPSTQAGIAEGLWQHTCCEIFLARAGEPAYHELNFSPSGQWTAYAFRRYREGAPNNDASLDPQIRVRRDKDKLELEAVITLSRLSPAHATGKLSIAVSAVTEDHAGRLSYWALRHAPGKPDFHHPDAFALELDELRH
jgi:hypothetical protein